MTNKHPDGVTDVRLNEVEIGVEAEVDEFSLKYRNLPEFEFQGFFNLSSTNFSEFHEIWNLKKSDFQFDGKFTSIKLNLKNYTNSIFYYKFDSITGFFLSFASLNDLEVEILSTYPYLSKDPSEVPEISNSKGNFFFFLSRFALVDNQKTSFLKAGGLTLSSEEIRLRKLFPVRTNYPVIAGFSASSASSTSENSSRSLEFSFT